MAQVICAQHMIEGQYQLINTENYILIIKHLKMLHNSCAER